MTRLPMTAVLLTVVLPFAGRTETATRLPLCEGVPTETEAFAAFVRRNVDPKKTTPTWPDFWRRPDRFQVIANAATNTMNWKLNTCGTWHQYEKGKIDWRFNPTYNKYCEYVWQLGRHYFLDDLAAYYSVTKDERAAETWRDMVTSWIRGAPCNENNKTGWDGVCWRSLDAALRVTGWSKQYPVFKDSPALSAEFVALFMRSVWEHGDYLRHHTTDRNWLVYELTGLLRLSVTFPFFRESREWKEYALQRMERELRTQLYPDGFHYELSSGYHSVIDENYTEIISFLRSMGEQTPAFIDGGLENAYSLYVKLVRPDGRMPALNDAGEREVKEVMERALPLYPNRQDFRFLATNGRKGEKPAFDSIALPYSGAVVMRTGWGPKDIWAYMDCGPVGRGHQHEDKLNVLLWAYGKEMLTEGGIYKYDTSEMRQYVLLTRSHNSVRVDNREQNRRVGYEWHDEDLQRKADFEHTFTPAADWCAARYAEGYGDEHEVRAEHARRLVFVKDAPGLKPFFAVVDRLSAADDATHGYEVLWHLEDCRYEQTARRFVADFGDGVTLTGFASADAFVDKIGRKQPYYQGWKPVLTDGPHEHRPIHTPTVEGTFAKAKRVVTVLYPSDGGRCPIADVLASEKPGSDTFTLVLENGTRLELNESGRPAAKWLTYPGDAELWLGNRYSFGRLEWGGYTVPTWPMPSPYAALIFTKEVKLDKPETARIAADGHCTIRYRGLGDHAVFNLLTDTIELPAGAYTIWVMVGSMERAPAFYLDAPSVKSDCTWKVSPFDVNTVAAQENSSDIRERPCDFRLPTRPEPAAALVREENRLLVDFGQETYGYLKLEDITGSGRVKVVYGETEPEARSYVIGPRRDPNVADVWEEIDLVAAKERVLPEARGFRYVHVIPETGDVRVGGLSMLFEHLPVERQGSFRSSDDRLNEIYEAGVRTLELTTREFVLDGIKRDRWIWSGDAYQTFRENYYTFPELGAVQRTIRYLLGKRPVTQWVNSLMDYTLYILSSVADYYRFTGDVGFLRSVWPMMLAQAEFCASRETDGMLEDTPTDRRIYIDHDDMLKTVGGPVSYIQIIYAKALEDLATVGRALDEKEDAARFAAKAAALRTRIRALFWDERAKAFANMYDRQTGRHDGVVDRYANHLAILYGYVSDDEARHIAKSVLLNPKLREIHTPFQRFWELEALFQAGEGKRALEEIRGWWGDMIDQGATSFWEYHEKGEKPPQSYAMYGRPYGRSWCHAWGAAPVWLLMRRTLGVVPTAPGFATYEVAPELGALAWMEGDVPTPHGKIHVRVERNRVEVHGAPNTVGTVKAFGKTVRVEGSVPVELKSERPSVKEGDEK